MADQAVALSRSLDANFVGSDLDQIVFQAGFVFDIALLLASLDFVERRLGDKKMPSFHQLRHLAVEKGQEQRPNMRTVDVGVGHDDDAMVAQLRLIVVFLYAGAQGHNHQANFLRRQHLIEARFFDV